MAKLTVYDTIFVPREVEIPEACPKCATVFRDVEQNALEEWEWTDVSHGGHVVEGQADHGTFEAVLSGRSGDEHKPVGYRCDNCDTFIAMAGQYTFTDRPNPGPQREKQLAAALRECED